MATRRLRTILSVAALSAVFALSGCVVPGGGTRTAPPPESSSESGVDDSSSAQAVRDLGGRIVDATVTPFSAGLGKGLSISFEVADPAPVGVDELRSVIEAARDAAPSDPNTVNVVAYVADGTTMRSVDTWTAGNELFILNGGETGTGIMIDRAEIVRVLGPWAGQ